MCVGMFMAILDVQVVATSITVIQKSVGIEPDRLSWLQTAYLIAEVIAIPLTGYLTRLLTARWLFVIAIALFARSRCALWRLVSLLLASRAFLPSMWFPSY